MSVVPKVTCGIDIVLYIAKISSAIKCIKYVCL